MAGNPNSTTKKGEPGKRAYKAKGLTVKKAPASKTPVYTPEELRKKRKKFMFTNSKGVTSRYGDI